MGSSPRSYHDRSTHRRSQVNDYRIEHVLLHWVQDRKREEAIRRLGRRTPRGLALRLAYQAREALDRHGQKRVRGRGQDRLG